MSGRPKSRVPQTHWPSSNPRSSAFLRQRVIGEVGSMLWRLQFYKDRLFHFLTILGAEASVLGLAIPGPFSEGSVVWWKLAVLTLSLLCTVVAIVLVFKSEHPTRIYRIGADTDIANYLYRWIRTGGHVVICTRDMSWAGEPKMKDLLKHKASSRELTIILPKEVNSSNCLKAKGAEIFAHGNLEPLATRFSIVNYGQPGARVAIGWRSGDRHLIQEFSAADEHPTFYLAHDLVKLARDRTHAQE